MKNDEKEKDASVCKSIFRSGDNTVTKEQFTKAWIAMINRMEKSRSINTARQE